MGKLISCGFNVDTACVQMRFTDGCAISIYCPAVEDEVAENRHQRSELDWLVYNEPLTYAQLVLSGNVNAYLKRHGEHGLQD
ncbi:MAG: DUF6061 family protein [Faecousia sp.]